MLTGGLGHERGRRVEVGQYTSAAEGTGQTPYPGDTLSGGGSWEGGLEVGAACLSFHCPLAEGHGSLSVYCCFGLS